MAFMRRLAVLLWLLCAALSALGQSWQTQALNKGSLPTNASLLDDFDHDGDLDIILIRRASDSTPPAIEWLENDATQQFPRHLLYTDSSLVRPVDIRKCDCDGDGRTDYVVSDAGPAGSNGQVFVLQRQADGTFVKWTVDATSDFKQADVGDFNHDGHPDIVAVASGLKTVNVYLNDGSFNFTKKPLATAVSNIDQVQAVDIDGDGDIDIVCSGWIFRNNGDGTFDAGQQLITYIANGFGFGMAVADLNGDGKLDVLAFASIGPGGLYFFSGATNFSTAVIDVAPNELGGDIRVVDLDGNGLKDVIRQNIATGVVTVLYQDSPMHFTRSDLLKHWDASGGPSRMAVGDLDGDGDPDLVFPGGGLFEQDLYWFENISGRLYQHRLYGTFRGLQQVKAVDLDADGDLDLLVTIGENITATDQVLWLENRGTRGFVSWLIADDLKSPSGIDAADLDGDGKADVIVSASDSNSLSWYSRNGPAWQVHTIDANLNHPLGIAIADLDRDGDTDVVAVSGNDAKVFWYANDGHGVFQRHVVDASLTNPRDVKVADVDADGDLDVVVAAASDNSAAVYLNDGAQNFTREVLQTGLAGAAVDVGDYDRDGFPNIVVAYNSSRTSDPDIIAYQFQPGANTFAASTLVSALHNVTAVRLADIDRDGALDLLAGSDTPGDTSPVELYLNRGTFGQPVDLLPRASATITSIDAGNLDADGAPEVVATDYRFGVLDRIDSTASSGPAAPQISFIATPSVIDVGGSATLNWSTTFADSVSIDNGIGPVATSGSRPVSGLVAPVTYVLTATGPGGTTTAPFTVTVLNPLTAGISVVPSSIHTGESATLVWSTTGATTVTLEDTALILSTQQVSPQGTKSVSPATTTIYTLTAQVGAFKVSSSTQLNVSNAAAPVIGAFTAAPASTTTGQSATLMWNSSGGFSASIDHGVGTVNAAAGSVVVAPALTTTYTFTVRGTGGVSMRSVTLVVGNADAATVSTVAGTGQAGSTDGSPAQATFTRPFAVTVAPHTQSGSSSRVAADAALSFDIYVLDSNHTIRRIAPDGTTSTFAGTAGVRGSKNGFRTSATFDFSNYTGAITANGDGTFEVVDAGGVQRHIDVAGNVTSLCASCARFPLPAGIVRLADRTTLISDAGNHTISRVTALGATTIIGTTGKAGFRDGTADQALFNRPRGLTIDTAGNVYVLDTGNNAVRKINPQNVVSTVTVSGGATKGGDLVLGCCASGIAPAPGGGVYVTDPDSNTVKQIASDGSITTVAGSGASGSANGTGASASFNSPLGVATAPDGSLVVSDTENNKVRSIVTPAAAARRRAAKH